MVPGGTGTHPLEDNSADHRIDVFLSTGKHNNADDADIKSKQIERKSNSNETNGRLDS